MKKLFSVLFVCFLTAFALCGCNDSGYKMVTGQVTAVEYDGVGYPKYTVLTPDGYEVGITLDDTTLLFSWIADVDAEKLRTGDISDWDGIKIVADCNYDKIKPLSKGGKYETVPQITIDAALYKNAKTLADGTVVDMWKYHNKDIYQLADGTELLWVNNLAGSENVYVFTEQNFGDLNETAKTKVMEYYNNRGLLYDVDFYLEQAYEDYKNGVGEFDGYMLEQSISPTASNDKIICFMTSVTTPIYDKRESTESRYGEIFDKETGEYISGYDIFNCDREQIITTILENGWGGFEAEISDTEKAEISEAFKPDYIILRDEGMDIAFPKGTLPSQEHTYILSIKYNNDAIKAIMHPWAIPNQDRG